jgi:hypothetical protein
MTVTDIQILKDGQGKPGDNWLKDNHDLNSGAGSESPYLYLAWEKDGSSGPITDLDIVDRDKKPREGFVRIPGNLNEGTTSSDGKDNSLYLYVRRNGSGEPIRQLAVVRSTDPDAPAPQGFTRCDPDLNEDAGGDYVFLCYRR